MIDSLLFHCLSWREHIISLPVLCSLSVPFCGSRGFRLAPFRVLFQPRLAYALTYSRYRNVTICARVQAPFGPNRPLLCPLVMPFSSAHCTAAA